MNILMSYNTNEGHGALGRYIELANFLLKSSNNLYYISPNQLNNRIHGKRLTHFAYKKRNFKPQFLYVWIQVLIIFLKNLPVMKNIDHCVLFSGSSAFIFALLKSFFKYQLVYSIRGNFVNHGNIENYLYKKSFIKYFLMKMQFKFYYLLEYFILKRADKVVFQSEINADEYKEMYNVPDEKRYILYNNCNPSWVGQRRGIPLNNSFNIAYIGNIFTAKGTGVLIDAFNLVYQKKKNLYLTIIGDGPDRKYYESYVKKLNIDQNVKFLGKQPNASELMFNFDLVVVPSFMEAFPNVALEAIYHKVPVLGSNVGGIPIILGKEYVFEVGNIQELSQKILMITEPENYTKSLDKFEEIREKFFFDWSNEFYKIIVKK